MNDKEKFYREQLDNYPIKQVKNNLGEKAEKVWDDMDTKSKLITCIKLEKDGEIKKDGNKYV